MRSVPTVPTQKTVKGTEQPEFLAPGKGGGQEIDCAAKTESVPLSAATDQVTHHNFEPQQQGYECGSCWNLLMHFHAPHPNERQVFQWACQARHKPLIVPYGSERVLIAPPECQDWKRWQQPAR
jgi:hypothetical protein